MKQTPRSELIKSCFYRMKEGVKYRFDSVNIERRKCSYVEIQFVNFTFERKGNSLYWSGSSANSNITKIDFPARIIDFPAYEFNTGENFALAFCFCSLPFPFPFPVGFSKFSFPFSFAFFNDQIEEVK